MTYKVMTLNMWNTSGPYAKRRARMREWIEKLDPDVIGFQEVVQGDGRNTVEELVDGLGYNTDFAVAEKWDQGEFGNSVASRYPMTKRKVVELPNGGTDEKRVALSVIIAAPFGDVSFTCTHLNWKFHHSFVREQQIVPLVDLVLKMRPVGEFPPVLVGDFNADPDSTEIRYVTGLHAIDGRSAYFYDAWKVAGEGDDPSTWNNRNEYAAVALEPDRRIDYIFAGYPVRMGEKFGVGRIEHCRVVCNDEVDGVWPSDHFGLYAEMRTEPAPQPSFGMS